MGIAVYKAVIDEEDLASGVFGISLVEDPAMESNFIALSKSRKQIVKFATVKGEERTVCGVVMYPDKPIYRNDENGEYYLTFSKETIKQSAHALLLKGLHHNSTIEHETPINGVSIVESWIVEDPKNDKANFHGLEVTAGTWVAKMKITNDNIWNNYVKTGLVKGFSIDGFFSFQKTNINLKSSKMSKKKSFLAILAGMTKGKAKFKRVQSDDNPDLMFDYDGEDLELGLTLYVVIEATDESEEVKEVAPAGVYYLESKEVEVDADGIIIRIDEEEEITEEEAIELAKQHFEKPLRDENTKLKIQVATLKAQVAKLGGKDNDNPRTKANLRNQPKASGKKALDILRANRAKK